MRKFKVKKNILYTTVYSHNDEAIDKDQIETCIPNRKIVNGGIFVGILIILLIAFSIC